MAKKIGKEAMSRHLAHVMGGKLSLSASKQVVDALHDLMTEHLLKGDDISLHGIGTLSLVPTAGRTGVRPMTGEKILLPPGRKVLFKTSDTLKVKLMPEPHVGERVE